MKRILQVILTLFLISESLHGYANDLVFSKLSVENGLSNNLVKAIYKDSYGFIWFGTLEGLDRYDGVEIRPYASKFPEAVENVYAITEDYRKNLWVGTATGLFRYRSNIDRFDRNRIDSSNINVQSLAMLPDSNLCVGTTNGLYLVNTISLKTEHLLFNDLRNNKSNDITGTFSDKHGNCWLSTLSGLIRYSASDKRKDLFVFRNTPEEGYNSFTSICNIGNKIYLGTTNLGVVEFDLSSKVFSRGIDTASKIILTLGSDNKERLFVGTDGGGLKVIDIKTRKVEDIKTKTIIRIHSVQIQFIHSILTIITDIGSGQIPGA